MPSNGTWSELTLIRTRLDWFDAGQALEEHKDALESRETADVAVTESGAVVTVPTPDILEQSERFAEKEAIADGDINASLAKVSAPRQ